jgi:hypothetical protein
VKSTFLSVDAVTAKVRDSQNHNPPGLHPLIAEGEITHRENVSQFVNRSRTRTLPQPFRPNGLRMFQDNSKNIRFCGL